MNITVDMKIISADIVGVDSVKIDLQNVAVELKYKHISDGSSTTYSIIPTSTPTAIIPRMMIKRTDVSTLPVYMQRIVTEKANERKS